MKSTGMNRASIFVLGSLLCLALSHAQANEELGSATCKRGVPGGPCGAAWDFTSTGHVPSFYWVEKFVYDSPNAEWQAIAGPLSTQRRKGEFADALEPGYLYRIVGCAHKSKQTDCVGSTAFWVPVRPKNLDDIPDVVKTPNGYFNRHKNLDALDQIVDYNMALVFKLIYSVDMSSMPPMTKPAVSDVRELWGGNELMLEDGTIEYNVHNAYGDPDLREQPTPD